jgi:hypothetical protein
MTRTELAAGSATFIAIAAVDNSPASSDQHQAQTPSPPACVGADGSWKNWVWANVPMLSPNCAAEH